MSAKLKDFPRTEPYTPRSFVARDAVLDSTDTIEAHYRSLIDRDIQTHDELESLVRDHSELCSVIEQGASILHIRMTCQTDNPEYAKAFTDFVEAIRPMIRALEHDFDRKYLEARKRLPSDDDRYEVYDRILRARVDLYRPENLDLKKQIELISQKYQKICGAMSAEFHGKERTMPELAKFLLESDRSVRESAWRAMTARRLQDKDRLDDLFDRMFALRNQLAANSDCANYVEYSFLANRRFDYTPEDCRTYHDAVEGTVLHAIEEVLARRKEEMRLDGLRPWDIDNYGTGPDPRGRGPLQPFEAADDLVSKASRLFDNLDPELKERFGSLSSDRLLDLESRPGKAPGGYASVLCETRRSFIFMNPVGSDRDLLTLLHEAGHAFHTSFCAEQEPMEYRLPGPEFGEFASIGMEFLAGDYLAPFYSEEEIRRSRREFLEGKLVSFAWIATVDAFQHWLYSHPDHSRADRRQAWVDTQTRSDGGTIDWSGLDEEHEHFWHRQLHIFQYPFYYIEYGIATVATMQLWLQAKQDPGMALEHYKRALSLGGSRPLPELFAAANLDFDFSQRALVPLVDAIRAELAELSR